MKKIFCFLMFIMFGLHAQELDLSTNTPPPTIEIRPTESPEVILPESSLGKKSDNMIPAVAPSPASPPQSPSVPPIAQKVVPLVVTPKPAMGSMTIPEDKPYWIGARYYEKKSGGWGWIKRPEESWKKARWAAIKETPRKFHVPHRALKSSEEDHEFHYKLIGSFADYQIYDPVRDELLDVFVIEGYQSLGQQPSIDRKPGPTGRSRSKKSGAYTRRNNVHFDDDSF